MKLIIDIDENSRKQLFDIANNGLDIPLDLESIMIMAIVNGTPLIDVLTDFVEWENIPFPKKNVFMNAPVSIATTYLEEKNNADSNRDTQRSL